MNALTQAIYNRLKDDTMLAGMLSTYNNRPAIFTAQPVPGDAVLPYVIVSGPIADAPWDTKTGFGREITRDIRCYAEQTGSVMLVDNIAERVRQLFHRQMVAVNGYNNVMTVCSGPYAGSTDDAYGRIVTVRFILEVQ